MEIETILFITPIIIGLAVVILENLLKSRLYIDRLDNWIEEKEKARREDKFYWIIFWLLKKIRELIEKLKNQPIADGIKITIIAYLLEIIIYIAIVVIIAAIMVYILLFFLLLFLFLLSREESTVKEDRLQYRFDTIEEGFWDSMLKTKTLKHQEKTVGKLEPGGIFDEKGIQLIKDENGKIVGKITIGGIFEEKDTQIIKDENENKIGTVETDILGKRIITINYKDGQRKGRIEKNSFGETKVKWD